MKDLKGMQISPYTQCIPPFIKMYTDIYFAFHLLIQNLTTN